ncbi:unnamed protein product, partial [Musa acuminata subsp. burmannicoides]
HDVRGGCQGGHHLHLEQFLGRFFRQSTPRERRLGRSRLDTEIGGAAHYDDLVRYLKAYSTSEQKVYLSAATQCPFPDVHLQPAIDTGLLDYPWVQFYNNYCQYSPSNVDTFVQVWNQWVSVNVSKVFLGLPASPEAAGSGYVSPDVLVNKVLPLVNGSEKYGGIMLWNRYFDLTNNYSARVKDYVCPDRRLYSIASTLVPSS